MINEFVLTIMSGMVTLAGAYVCLWLKKLKQKVEIETEKIENKATEELITNAMIQVEWLAEQTVKAIEQTTAKELREAVKNGLASRDELTALASKAVKQIYNSLSDMYIDALDEGIGNTVNFIKNTVEAKVLELKREGC